MGDRIEYDPPVDGGVLCRHCHGKLLAKARILEGVQLAGCNEYEWIHTDGNPRCKPDPPEGQPYDGWAATSRVERALSARYGEAGS